LTNFYFDCGRLPHQIIPFMTSLQLSLFYYVM
jgi:hypothetical protein